MAHPLSRAAAFRLSLLFLLGALLLARVYLGRERLDGSDDSPAAGLPPRSVPGWEAVDLPVSAPRRAALGGDALIFRQYRAPGRAVNFYLVSAGADRAALHPPEYCFVGGATELTEEGEGDLPDGRGGVFRARRFLAAGPGGRSLVYYWYIYGGRAVPGYLEVQARIVLGRLSGKAAPAFLVRVSVEGTFDLEEGERAIREFLRAAPPGRWAPGQVE
jgi:EpsI family protein